MYHHQGEDYRKCVSIAKWNSDLVKKDMEMAKVLNGLALKITAGNKLTPKKKKIGKPRKKIKTTTENNRK